MYIKTFVFRCQHTNTTFPQTFQQYYIHHHCVSCTAPVGASCIEPTRFTRARHLSRSCARGSTAAGPRLSWSRSRLTTSNQRVRGGPSGSLPAEQTRVEVQDIPRRMVRWQAKHMSIPEDLVAGSQRGGWGLSSKGLHRFIGNEVTPVDANNRSESPTVKAVKPGGEGSSEWPGLRAVQQHRQDCSIVYAHLGGTRNRLLAPQWQRVCAWFQF